MLSKLILFLTFLLGQNTALTICPGAIWSSNATTVAGSSVREPGASLELLSNPDDVFVDNNSNIYVLDSGNYRVQLWLPDASAGITILSGSAGSNLNQFSTMDTMSIDGNGNIYVLDGRNARVMKWTPKSPIGSIVAGGNGEGASNNQMQRPGGMFVTTDILTTIWIADSRNHRIMIWTSPLTGVLFRGSGGSNDDQFNYPEGLFVDETASNTVYVADSNNHRIMMWLPNATSGINVAGITGFHGTRLDQLRYPRTLVVDTNRIMFISDAGNSRILQWTLGSSFGVVIAEYPAIGVTPDQIYSMLSLAFDSNGSLYVSDRYNSRVQKFEITCEAFTNSATPSTTLMASISTQSTTLSTTSLTTGTQSITTATMITTRPSIAVVNVGLKHLVILICTSIMFINK